MDDGEGNGQRVESFNKENDKGVRVIKGIQDSWARSSFVLIGWPAQCCIPLVSSRKTLLRRARNVGYAGLSHLYIFLTHASQPTCFMSKAFTVRRVSRARGEGAPVSSRNSDGALSAFEGGLICSAAPWNAPGRLSFE